MQSNQVANLIVGAIIKSVNGLRAKVTTFKGHAQANVRIAHAAGICSGVEGQRAILAALNGSTSRYVTVAFINPNAPECAQDELVVFDPSGEVEMRFNGEGIAITVGNPENFTVNGVRVALQGDPISTGGVIV